MPAPSRARGWQRIRQSGLVVLAAAALGTGTVLVGAPAVAGTVVSPTGMVTVSGPSPIQSGAAATYTVTVTNTTSSPFDGPAGVVADGTMPAGFTLHGVRGCTSLGGGQSTSFLCTMPNLAAGASESMTFTVVGSAAGDYQLGVGASAEFADPSCGTGCQQSVGDQANLPVTVLPGPTDLQVTGSSDNGSPAVGSTFTYTFQVKDNGPLAAGGVSLDDALPASIALGGTVSTDHGTCTTATNSVHCVLGDLAVGQQAVITVPASATATGTFGNTATVAMTNTDTRPANNSVTVTVQPR